MQRHFEIFSKTSASPLAVKRGFSWPGFFFLWIWAFSRGLWLQASLLLLADAVIGILQYTIFAQQPVFWALAPLALSITVGLKGNFWRSRKLEREGYDFIGLIPAKSPSHAISIFSRGDQSKLTRTKSVRGFSFLPAGLQRIAAIAWLTWKAAIRFRLFAVIAVLLVLAVVGLPLIVKDDGTAKGFTEIILTYTLSAVTILLGFSTLWLSCGTLARDIEECQIQVVATKPIARWQIWLGKWLGIALLNAVLLILAGGCIYGLLQWRASKLPAQERADLRSQVMVARGSAREPNQDAEINAETEQVLQNRLKQNPVTTADLAEVRKQIREEVKADFQLVPPGYTREWRINLGHARDFLQNKPLQLRIKFNSASHSPSGTYIGAWQIGDQSSTNLVQIQQASLSPDNFHEFQIPPNLFKSNGELDIVFLNVNATALLFPLEDGMEVLYPESGFTVNFIRALGIIFCWLVLLSAIGLMAASFLSFPVATFFSLAMLVLAFSSDTIAEAIDTGGGPATTHSLSDMVMTPVYGGLLYIINLAEKFSPIDAVSTGRSIPWSELATAFGQIVFLLGGIFALIGIILFNRRELATAQTQ